MTVTAADGIVVRGAGEGVVTAVGHRAIGGAWAMLGAGSGAGATFGTGRLGLLLLLRTIRVMLTAKIAMLLYKKLEIDERRDVQKRKVCMRERERGKARMV